MKTKRTWLFLFWLSLIVLVGCGSPFAPLVLAPNDVIMVKTPQELPEALRLEIEGIRFARYEKYIVQIDTGEIIEWPEPDQNWIRHLTFSRDGVYLVYVLDGAVGNDRVIIKNLETGETEVLLEQREIPNSAFFGDVAISPDNRRVLVAVFGNNGRDLIEINRETRTVRFLNVDVSLAGFGGSDISPDGKILVQCSSISGNRPYMELCLLDERGKFIRYLTREKYLMIQGKFTPDGEWVIYESRFKLYKVHIDGSVREEVAPCGGWVYWVTESYVFTSCVVSQEPTCAALFLAELGGDKMWQLNYLEPHCQDD